MIKFNYNNKNYIILKNFNKTDESLVNLNSLFLKFLKKKKKLLFFNNLLFLDLSTTFFPISNYFSLFFEIFQELNLVNNYFFFKNNWIYFNNYFINIFSKNTLILIILQKLLSNFIFTLYYFYQKLFFLKIYLVKLINFKLNI